MTLWLIYLCVQIGTMDRYTALPSNDIAVVRTRAGTGHHHNTF
jgi:hypothetical protein